MTLADRSCAAQDFGSFEGLGDEHFWVWCSREETEEERLEHGDEPGGLGEDFLLRSSLGVKSTANLIIKLLHVLLYQKLYFKSVGTSLNQQNYSNVNEL